MHAGRADLGISGVALRRGRGHGIRGRARGTGAGSGGHSSLLGAVTRAAQRARGCGTRRRAAGPLHHQWRFQVGAGYDQLAIVELDLVFGSAAGLGDDQDVGLRRLPHELLAQEFAAAVGAKRPLDGDAAHGAAPGADQPRVVRVLGRQAGRKRRHHEEQKTERTQPRETRHDLLQHRSRCGRAGKPRGVPRGSGNRVGSTIG